MPGLYGSMSSTPSPSAPAPWYGDAPGQQNTPGFKPPQWIQNIVEGHNAQPKPQVGTQAWYDYMIGKVKNPTLKTIYADVNKAMNGPDLYSQNDVRNATLGIASSAGQSWRDFQQGANSQAAASGMQDSGFYGDYLARAGAKQAANINASQVATANNMAQENQSYRQNAINSSLGLLSAWLGGKRGARAQAMELANAAGPTTGGGVSWGKVIFNPLSLF